MSGSGSGWAGVLWWAPDGVSVSGVLFGDKSNVAKRESPE